MNTAFLIARRALGTTAAAVTLLSATLLASPDARAARISEPDTVLYGRIVERHGDRAFALTQGNLVWTLRVSGPGGREVRLNTRLESLGQGRFSYRLRIPHEVLAYDLSVNAKAVGLASTDQRAQHLAVTLDGQPLTITPGAIDGFALAQARRAGVQRIDLETQATTPDTDGDGAPDWWEDQQGLDRYDPSDAKETVPTSNTGGENPAIKSVRTFAEWRAAWFPQSTGDLAAFGQEDPDGDGISNFLEYAFSLVPNQADDPAHAALPHAVRGTDQVGVAFRQRAEATDLAYLVETSTDLFNWETAGSDVEVRTKSDASTVASVLGTGLSSSAPQRFFRVRVQRQ